MSYQTLRERLLARPRVKASYDRQVELSKLGRLIQRARTESNLRQQDLAALSGVAQGDISRLEIGAGERGPTFDTLVRLAHAQDMQLVVELVPIATAEPAVEPIEHVELNESSEDSEEDEPRSVLREAF